MVRFSNQVVILNVIWVLDDVIDDSSGLIN